MIKFDQVIQRNPRNTDALWGKAEALFIMKEYDLALDSCQRALQVDPNNAMAYGVQSNMYRMMAKYDLALNAINMALMINPNHGGYYNTRGDVYDEMGLYEYSLKDYETAISLSLSNTKSNQAVHHFNYASTCVTLNKLDTALGHCNKSIELNLDDDSSYALRALIYVRLNQHENAMKEFNMLMSKDELLPVHHQFLCYRRIGLMFLEMKDIDHALEYFQKSGIRELCGIVLYMKGDFKNAMNELSKYFKKFPGDAMNLIQHGAHKLLLFIHFSQ